MFLKKDVYNAKIKNIEDKISDITNLAATTALNAKINEVKNKILNITNLVKKMTNFNTKISEIETKITTDDDHDKYITTQELKKSTSENFTARLA